MDPLVARVGSALLTALASMGWQLVSERFLKRVVVMALTWVSKKTKTDRDDELLKAVKEAWGVE